MANTDRAAVAELAFVRVFRLRMALHPLQQPPSSFLLFRPFLTASIHAWNFSTVADLADHSQLVRHFNPFLPFPNFAAVFEVSMEVVLPSMRHHPSGVSTWKARNVARLRAASCLFCGLRGA